MGNYVDRQRKILPKYNKKISNNTISTRQVRHPMVISDNDGREYVFYASSLFSSADVTVSIDTGLNINVIDGMVNHDDVTVSWTASSITLAPSSFNYIVVNNLGDIEVKSYFEDNWTLLAVAITTVTDIIELYNFPEKGEYILVKLQTLANNGKWKWEDQSPIHIISSGKYPNAIYDTNTNILILTYLKDNSLYKREIDLNKDISEYQYIRDYVIVGNSLSLNHLKRKMKSSGSSYGELEVNPNNVIRPTGNQIIYGHSEIDVNEKKIITPTLESVNVNYFTIDEVVIYNETKDEIVRVPYVAKDEIDLSIYPSGIYYLGFVGEYSYFNNRVGVTDYITADTSLFELDFTQNTDRLEDAIFSNSANGQGSFEITRTIEYLNTTEVDGFTLTSGAMTKGSFEITRTIEYLNTFQGDSLGLSAGATGHGSITINTI